MAEKTACPTRSGKKSLLMIETELSTMAETVKLIARFRNLGMTMRMVGVGDIMADPVKEGAKDDPANTI